MVNEILRMLSPSQHIHIVVENELPCMLGNQTGLYQVFQNLLSNAINHMDKAEGEIRIRCVDDDTSWIFCIADNRPGIEERHFEKIFRPFQSANPHPLPESAGVGLAIVKKVMEASGGKVWLESVIGQGSTFWFSLPKKTPPMSSSAHFTKQEEYS